MGTRWSVQQWRLGGDPANPESSWSQFWIDRCVVFRLSLSPTREDFTLRRSLRKRRRRCRVELKTALKESHGREGKRSFTTHKAWEGRGRAQAGGRGTGVSGDWCCACARSR